jgi:hypothetical protein
MHIKITHHIREGPFPKPPPIAMLGMPNSRKEYLITPPTIMSDSLCRCILDQIKKDCAAVLITVKNFKMFPSLCREFIVHAE